MNVTLSDALKPWVEGQMQMRGHASVDAFVEDVLRQEQQRFCASIDKKLKEALDSGPPILADAAFWEERRRVLEERLQTKAT